METPPETDNYLDYSMVGFDISNDLLQLDKQSREGQASEEGYNQRLSELAARTLAYLTESQRRFPDEFSIDMEAETFRRSLSAERQRDFAVCFNELLYASISESTRPIDAIADKATLQHAVDLTQVADRIDSKNFYEQPNRVRELGDAVIGRAVLTMLSFNEDPRRLRIPDRN